MKLYLVLLLIMYLSIVSCQSNCNKCFREPKDKIYTTGVLNNGTFTQSKMD